MAHMVETMAYAGEVPWHGLGVQVNPNLSPKEMMKEANVDWTVEKRPLYYNGMDKKEVIPGKEALVRSSDGQLLDVVGTNWKPLQNEDAFNFFNDFVNAGDMEMHTAGSLDNGRRVWALAKVKDSFEVFKNDQVDQYLLFSNPHKYASCIDVRMTPIRVVCNNTLSFALDANAERMVQVTHRNNFNPDMVKETLGVAKEKLDTYKEAAKFLASKRTKQFDVNEYMDKIFPSLGYRTLKKGENRISKSAQYAVDVMDTQPGAEFGKGTWWQAFNAVTYTIDHAYGLDQDKRINSAWFGANAKKKTMALQKAIEYAEAA